MKIIYFILILVTGVSATFAIDWRPGIDEFIIRENCLILSVCFATATLGWCFFMKSKGVSPYSKDEGSVD